MGHAAIPDRPNNRSQIITKRRISAREVQKCIRFRRYVYNGFLVILFLLDVNQSILTKMWMFTFSFPVTLNFDLQTSNLLL